MEVICANILIKKDNKFILIRRSPLKKFAPNVVVSYGGKLEKDESPIEAAIREVREEAGVEVKNIQLNAVVTEIHQDEQMMGNWLVFYFFAEYKSGEFINTPEGEKVELSLEEMKNENLFPAFKEILPHITIAHKNPIFARFVYNKQREIIEKNITVI